MPTIKSESYLRKEDENGGLSFSKHTRKLIGGKGSQVGLTSYLLYARILLKHARQLILYAT